VYRVQQKSILQIFKQPLRIFEETLQMCFVHMTYNIAEYCLITTLKREQVTWFQMQQPHDFDLVNKKRTRNELLYN